MLALSKRRNSWACRDAECREIHLLMRIICSDSARDYPRSTKHLIFNEPSLSFVWKTNHYYWGLMLGNLQILQYQVTVCQQWSHEFTSTNNAKCIWPFFANHPVEKIWVNGKGAQAHMKLNLGSDHGFQLDPSLGFLETDIDNLRTPQIGRLV